MFAGSVAKATRVSGFSWQPAAFARTSVACRHKSVDLASAGAEGSHAPENEAPIREFKDIDGPNWFWLLKLVQNPITIRSELYERIGHEQGVVRVRWPGSAGSEPCALIFNQEDAKYVYQNEGKDCDGSATSFWPIRAYHKRHGEGEDNLALSLSLSGQRSHDARRVLHAGINTDAVSKYEPLVQEAARFAVDHAEQYLDKWDLWTQYSSFDMFASLTLGSNSKTVDPDAISPLREVVHLDGEGTILSIKIAFTPPFMVPRGSFDKMTAALDRITEIGAVQVDELFDVKDVPPCWFKDLRDEQKFTRAQLVNMLGPLLSAATATTKTLMQWFSVALLYYPEVQTKLRHEIQSVLGGKPYTRADKIPYLEAVMREVTRFYPMNPLSSLRRLTHDVVLPVSRVRIPAGTLIELSPQYATRDKRLIPDADVFDPERFNREVIRTRKACPIKSPLDAAVSRDPFGNGSRACLGKRAAELELRTLICELLQRYELVMDPPGQPETGNVSHVLMMPKNMPTFKLVPVKN